MTLEHNASKMVDIASLEFDFASVRVALSEGISPAALIAESYRRAQATAHDGIFTALVPEEEVRRRAELLESARLNDLPLLGLTFSIKDNIHYDGLPTTANCPALHFLPDATAPAVAALEAAGAVMIGKNTLDQFATGLNGTRSPQPLCRNALNPNYIPGGSSSGSAVAVALNIVSFSLGSDTGGSGRVPAACNGIVGVKPTIGFVSSRGLLYNSRLFDCIPIFSRYCADANEIFRLIAGYDPIDPFSRRDADTFELSPTLPILRTLAIPKSDHLRFFGDSKSEAAFAANLAVLEEEGFDFVDIDFSPFEEAGRLLFSSALVAERLVDYEQILNSRPQAIDPSVGAAIVQGRKYSAKEAFEAVYRVKTLQRLVQDSLASFAALIVPTVPTIFTMDEMLAEPVSRNHLLGTYTYFVNPLDLCAISVPGVHLSDNLRSAISIIGLPTQDGALAGIAASFEEAVSRRAWQP